MHKINKYDKKENPLLSIIFNILIPVILLKNGTKWIEKILGDNSNNWPIDSINIPSFVFFIALIFPFIYFLYDLLNRKNINLISILGFVNVLLNGGIGIFGSSLGLTKNWFIIKEGSLPLIIGILLFATSKYKKQSFNSILLNGAIFDLQKIKTSIIEERQSEFDDILKKAGYYLIAGFFISSIIQFILASFIVVSEPGQPSFNEQVSTMTWVSYLAVLVPTILLVGKGYLGLISDLEKITSLKKEDFLKT